MKINHDPSERLNELFQRQKCWMIANLTETLCYATISIRRFLKELGYWRSFTHNNKWYTLRSIPKFDGNGLWFYQDIGFSRHGSLKQTISHFVDHSLEGLPASELANLIKHPCHALLNQMVKCKQINRFKALGHFIYLSADRTKYDHQFASLRGTLASQARSQQLTPQAAIQVFAEAIKNPEASCEQLAALTAQKNIIASPDAIACLFGKHGIKKN